MPAAARLSDPHTCPATTPGTPGVPHVGGPLLGPGVGTVMIGGLPAAVQGDQAVCAGPPDAVVQGSRTVRIAGRPAARVGDATAHGGVITGGCNTVMIGS
ncbi:MAG: PAAR domain-containing protein [Burkholderiales bacterium]|nr:PAAR domain-containing protein [Burkholderiales bacterium]